MLSEFPKRHASKIRWAIIGLIVLAAVAYAVTNDWQSYTESWGGTMFKALNGGVVGWLVSRFVIGLDISALPPEQRPMAALSQAILIAAFAVALATGA